MSAPMGTSDEIKSAGTLGLVGSILMLLGSFAPILGVGLILVLIALNKLSKAYNNKTIWRNALYGFVMGMVGVVVLTILVFDYMIPILITLFSFHLSSLIFFIVFSMIGCAIVVAGCGLLGNAYNELAESSRIYDFDDAAKWYRRGAPLFSYGARLLGIVSFPLLVIVGVILIIVGHIYALLGYSKLRSKLRFLPLS